MKSGLESEVKLNLQKTFKTVLINFILFIMLSFFIIIYIIIIKVFKNKGNLIFSFLPFVSSFMPSTKSNQIDLNQFPPIKVYCYNISDRWHLDDPSIRKYMYYPDSEEFKYYIEVEVHKELLLSPLLTKNPEEADFFYIPVYPFAVHYKGRMDMGQLITEIRRIGPWFDRKNGADHIDMWMGLCLLWQKIY